MQLVQHKKGSLARKPKLKCMNCLHYVLYSKLHEITDSENACSVVKNNKKCGCKNIEVLYERRKY